VAGRGRIIIIISSSSSNALLAAQSLSRTPRIPPTTPPAQARQAPSFLRCRAWLALLVAALA
jgi:hypothetical protein